MASLPPTAGILAILGLGSVVGELSMIDGAPRSASVTALRDSTLCFVNQADFGAIGKSNPGSRRNFLVGSSIFSWEEADAIRADANWNT